MTWTQIPTQDERARLQATRKAERAVRRYNRGPSTAGFEVDFSPQDESVRFKSESLLRIFCDIRDKVPVAQPRLNARGGITVRVPQQAQIETLKSITVITDVPVILNLPTAASLWGRVDGCSSVVF